jgi:hypothetical protein
MREQSFPLSSILLDSISKINIIIYIKTCFYNKYYTITKICNFYFLWICFNCTVYLKNNYCTNLSGGQISLLVWKKLVFVMRISIGLSTFFWMKSWDLLK